MTVCIGAQTQMYDVWLQQHQSSLQISDQCTAQLSKIADREKVCHQAHSQAVQKALDSQKTAGWFSFAERITRLASAAFSMARGGWQGAACSAGLIGLETASMTGGLQRAQEAAERISPTAATAVRVGTTAVSLGLSAWSISQGSGAGGWGGVLQGGLAIGSGISAISRGVVESQGKHHEATALEHESQLLELAGARQQLQQRIEQEAQLRQRLMTQLQESMEAWSLPVLGA